MGYAQYIGRIGALAVALGVTSAVAHPQLALAEEPSSTGSSDAGTASPDTAPPSGPKDKTEATTKDDSAEPSGGDEDASAPQSPAEPSDGEDDADSPSTAEPAAEDATSAEADDQDATQVEPTTTTHADTDTEAVAPRRETTDRSPAPAPDAVEPSTPAADDDLSFTTRALTVAGLDDQSLDSPIPVEPVVPLAKTLSTSVEQSVDATAPPEVAEVPPLESLALGVLGVLGGAGLDPTGTADEALLAAAWALYRRQESSADAEDAIDEPADVPEIGLGVEAAAFALLSAPANEAPTAVNDTKAMTQGVPRTFSPVELLSNDTDPERDALRVHSVADAVGGTAVLNADGTVTFTPTAGFNGAAAFTYIVEDAVGSVSANSATVTLNVRPNSAPIPTDDTKLLVQNVSRTFAPGELTYNDIDLEHDALRVHSVADAVGGSVVLNADGTVTFTPETDYTGSASFTYRVKDIYGLVGSNAATVILTVRANTAPTAGDDTKLVVQNVPRTLAPDELTYNDTDPEGDPRSIHSVDNAVGGTVVLNADGTVTFTPAPDYSGPASFTYRAKDSYGLAGNSATVALTVRANTAPTAGDDSKLLVENVSRTFVPGELTYNDTDPERDWRILHSVDNAVGGTVVLNADGTVTFTPETGYSGAASFTYQVKDSYGLVSNSANVALTVRPNTAPTPVDDAKIMVEDTPRTFVAGELTYNDIDAEHDARSIHSVTGATGGTAVLNADGTVTFTPAADYNGLASFTYKVKDIYGAVSATSATVNVTVLPVDDPDAGNHAPDAGTPAYQYTTQLRSGILSGTVTVNDPDGDTLSFTLTNTPSADIASVVIDSATGAWAFRPTPQARLDAWTNPDGLGVHFTIIASDGQASTPVEIDVQVSPAAFFDGQSVDLGLAGPDQVIAVSADGHVYLDGVGGLSVLNPDGSAGSEIPLDFTPTDAAVGSDGRIYATDHENGVVVVIDPADSSLTSLASLSNPGGIAVDTAGKVYVTSSDDRTLTILNADGSVANAFQLDSIPTDVAVGPQGQIYIAEIAEDLNSVRVTLRNADGSVAKVLYTSDSAPLGDYASPLGIAVGVNGAVYVSDPNQARFAAFDKDGEPADSLYLDGIGRGIAVTADGVVLLTNSLDGSLWVLTAGTLENGDFDYTVDCTTGVVSGEVFVLDPAGLLTFELTSAPSPVLGTVTVDEATGAWEFVPTPQALAEAAYGEYDGSYDYVSDAEFVITASDGTAVTISAPIIGLVNFDTDVIEEVGGSPAGLALDADGHLYIANRTEKSVTVLNTDGTVYRTIDLDFAPYGIAIWSDTAVIVVTNGVDNTLTLISPGDDFASSSFTLTSHPAAIGGVTFGDDGRLYVASEDADTVSVLRTTNTSDLTIDVENPTDIAIGPDGFLYVVGTDDDGAGYLNMYFSDGSPYSSVLLGGNPYGVAVGPTGHIYVTDLDGSPRDLAVVGPDGWLTNTLEIGGAGWGIDVAADGSVYVANPDDGTVTVLTPPDAYTPVGSLNTINVSGLSFLAGIAVTRDGQIIVTGADSGLSFSLDGVSTTGTITDYTDLGNGSLGVVLGPDSRLYVSDYIAGTVTAFDPTDAYSAEVVATLPGALGLAFGSDGTLYASTVNIEASLGTLATIDGDGHITVLLDLPGFSYDVAVAPDGRVLASYFSNASGGGVLVRNPDGTTESLPLPAGVMASGLAVGPDGTIFIADASNGRLIVRYPTGVTRAVEIGGQPFGLTLDGEGRVYITDPQSTTITVLTLSQYANHAPTVSDPGYYSGDSDGVVSGQLDGDDRDGDILTYSLVTQPDPTIGVAVVDVDTGEWKFTPTLQARLAAWDAWNDPDVPNHTVTLSISVSDGQYDDNVSFEVTIYPETAPVAEIPAFSITNTNTANGRVTGQINVVDADGDYLSYELASPIDPAIGSVFVSPYDGTWTFAPTKPARLAADLSAGDDVIVFNVIVSDEQTSVTVEVTASIVPLVSTTPQLGTPPFTIASTDPANGRVNGTVNVTDGDGDKLTYALAAAVDTAIGAVSVNSATGAWVFTPTKAARNAAYATTGDDTITFTVNASDGEHIVPVSITAPIAPNTGPQPATQAFTITNTYVSNGRIDGYLNVADAQGDQLTYALANTVNAAVGTVTVNSTSGYWSFTPTTAARNTAYDGGDQSAEFSITVSDGQISAVVVVTAPISPNTPPQPGTPPFTITSTSGGTVSGRVNVTDTEGGVTFSLSAAPDPTKGSVSYSYYSGTWTFTPTAQARLDAASTMGDDTTTFVITASDGTRTTDITVTTPIIPNLAAPQPGTPAFTITSTGTNGQVNGKINVTDPDGDSITYQLTTAPDPTIGSVYYSYYAGTWTFTPTPQARQDAAASAGDDTTTFVITASDGTRTTNITVTTPIIPNLAAPQPGTPAFTITSTGTNGQVNGKINVTDPDGDSITYQLTTAPDPTIGSVYYSYYSGTWTFTPTPQARLDAASTTSDDTTTFVITASDGTRTTDITVTTPIIPNLAAPQPGTPAFTITGTNNGRVNGTVNVTDPDGDSITYQLTTAPDPTIGNVSYSNYNGTWTFTPTLQARLDAASSTGDDTTTFVITASDGSRTTNVTVTTAIIPEVVPEAGTPPFAVTNINTLTAVATGTVNVTDADKDPLTYSLLSGVDSQTGNVTVNYYTGAWTFTPTAQARYEAWSHDETVTATFTVRATDGWAGADVVIAATIVPGMDPVVLQQLAANGDVLVSENADGTVRAINGTFVPRTVETAADAAAVLNVIAPLLGASAGFATVDMITTQQVPGADEDSSEVFYRLRPSVNGVPTLNASVVLVTDGAGAVTGVFSGFAAQLGTIDTAPTIDEQAAISAAKLVLRQAIIDEAGTDPDEAEIDAFLSSLSYGADLVIDERATDGVALLAWRVNILAASVTSNQGAEVEDPGGTRTYTLFNATYLIDAAGPDAGTYLGSDSTEAGLALPTHTSTDFDLLGRSRDFRVTTLPSGTYLWDSELGITTTRFYTSWGWNNVDAFAQDVMYTGDWPADAVSAHANVSEVYKYYRDKLKAFVTSITVYLDAKGQFNKDRSWNWDNAEGGWANGNAYIEFGDVGNNEAAIDFVAHEYTHVIIGGIGWLIYEGQSGALNEAYADIFGSLIQADIQNLSRSDERRWLIGEDTDLDPNAAGADRSLKDPSSYPSGSAGNYRHDWDDRYQIAEGKKYAIENDWGGVHANSTIVSHAFYRMIMDPKDGSWRGSGRTDSVTDEEWARVFYNSLYRLPSNATFVDARSAVISSAKSQGFTQSEIEAIQDAFDHVGIRATNYTYGVYKSTTLGSTPHDLAFGADKGRAYVIMQDNTIQVIDTAALSASGGTAYTPTTVDIGGTPGDIALASDGWLALATNLSTNEVAIIDTKVIDTVPVSNPGKIAVSENGLIAYVTSTRLSEMTIVDLTTGIDPTTVVVPLCAACTSQAEVAVSSDGSRAFITHPGADTVSIVSYSGVGVIPTVKQVSVNDPQSIATSADGSVAVVYSSTGRVSVISASGLSPTVVELPENFYSYRSAGFIALSADGTRAWVTNHAESNSVIVIDTSDATHPKVLWRVSVNDLPHSIATTADGTRAYVVAHNHFWVLDTRSGTVKKTPANMPSSITYNSASDYQQVAVSGRGDLVVATSVDGDFVVLNASAF